MRIKRKRDIIIVEETLVLSNILEMELCQYEEKKTLKITYLRVGFSLCSVNNIAAKGSNYASTSQLFLVLFRLNYKQN